MNKARDKMNFGLQINNFSWQDGPASMSTHVADLARAAEQNGFYSVWAMDHFFQIPDIGAPEEPILEVYAVLSYLAGLTKTVKLGAMVTGANYRYPGILIKTVTTLDVLSGGRAYFGIGAGWFEHEAHGLGVPFPEVKIRFERLEETLQIAKQMWSSNAGPYNGKHFQLAETLCSPQPISQPYPPILIGGVGLKKTLRFVAQYGDACNVWYDDIDDLTHKLDVVRQHCVDAGRKYEDIEKTVMSSPRGYPGRIDWGKTRAEYERIASVGVTHAIVEHTHALNTDDVERFGAEVIAAQR
jgi:F420-dependent oxidoreductase-like protein